MANRVAAELRSPGFMLVLGLLTLLAMPWYRQLDFDEQTLDQLELRTTQVRPGSLPKPVRRVVPGSLHAPPQATPSQALSALPTPGNSDRAGVPQASRRQRFEEGSLARFVVEPAATTPLSSGKAEGTGSGVWARSTGPGEAVLHVVLEPADQPRTVPPRVFAWKCQAQWSQIRLPESPWGPRAGMLLTVEVVSGAVEIERSAARPDQGSPR